MPKGNVDKVRRTEVIEITYPGSMPRKESHIVKAPCENKGNGQ